MFEFLKNTGGYFAVLFIVLIFLLWFLYTKLKILPHYYELQNAWHKLDAEIKLYVENINNLLEEITNTLRFKQQIMVDIAKTRKLILLSISVETKYTELNRINQQLLKLEDIYKMFNILNNNANIKKIKEEIKKINNTLYVLEDNYNNAVNKYNNLIQTFPHSVPATILNFYEYNLFKLEKL